MVHRFERCPASQTILVHERGEIARPGADVRRESGRKQLEEAAVQATVPLGNWPEGHPLIQISGDEPDQRWMHPRINVDGGDRHEQIAVPDRRPMIGRRRVAGARHRDQACVPEVAHRLVFGSTVALRVGLCAERAARVARHVGAKSR